jgi:hypothetical protein
MKYKLVLLVAVGLCGLHVSSDVVGIAGGPYVPPVRLGSYDITRFPRDERPYIGFYASLVDDVPSPLGGSLRFSEKLPHLRLGRGWDSWSGYPNGDVYFCLGRTLTLTLPENTRAFHFSIDYLGDVITVAYATTDTGAHARQRVWSQYRGHHFAFYAEHPTDPPIRSIFIDASFTQFVVGEFGIAIPEPTQPGDLNCDDAVDYDDLEPFVLAVLGRDVYEAIYPGCDYRGGDIDQNGAVNFEDIDGFIGLLLHR